MTNNFNAEQARKNAKDVKIDQALLLEKILSGTEEISKEGKRRAVFQFPIDALHPEHITQVEEELKTALLHKDLKVKTSHIYSNLSDNSGMWSA
ncbi:hypothetical protein [Acinetobacter baumannii]|uniref:Uncharacterized protein n=3 Tax=Acinetobacter baumannii TaxID=470 RepID=A0A009IKA3_ACIB9|nr:hypothetical protein [Acinetobacter baumannii]EXB05134.1 hypothetical protein J512_2456 [Acinetobacter baumannii 1295743]